MITAENMLRVGVVSSINADNHTARVYFPDAGNMVSDWLYVLQHPAFTEMAGSETEGVELTTQSAGDHTHNIAAHTHAADVSSVGLTANSDGDHEHSVTVEDKTGSADSAGAHTHSIDAHTHTVTNADVSLTTDSAGSHSHTIQSHWHHVEDHKHEITFWMPNVNDRVLVLMGCGSEMDGYIMGVIP